MKKLLFAGLFATLLVACAPDEDVLTPPTPITSPAQEVSTASTPATYEPFDATTLSYMDTLIRLVGYANSQASFNGARDAVFAEAKRLHQLFHSLEGFEGVNNVYTINQMAGIAPVVVDPLLLELIQLGIEAYEWTGGALNIALGPVLEVWHQHRHANVASVPDMALLQAQHQYTDIRDIMIDEEAQTVFLAHEHMQLDLGAIAKGKAVDLMFEVAQNSGLEALFLYVGGDIRLGARRISTGNLWSTGVSHPDYPDDLTRLVDIVRLEHHSIVTSGDYQRFFFHEGVRYHHIIDPSTLMPSTYFRAVTVLHPENIMANILSTAFMIMPPESAFELATRLGAEALWIRYDGALMVTPGYSRFSDHF